MNRRTVKTLAQLPAALQWAQEAAERGLAAGPVVVTVKRPTRKEELNALMWVRLTDFARDATHHGEKKSKEVWKIMLLALYSTQQGKERQWIIGLDGMPIPLDGTREMTNAEISDFITFIEAEGTERGVLWTAPKWYEGF